MVSLIVNEKYVDLPEKYVFEVKKPHPIANGLDNVYVAYSTDIELELTETNVATFDYSFYKNSSQVHKTLEGYLIRSNGVTVVDVIVRTFTKNGIKIYIVEKISKNVKGLLNGDFMLNELPYKNYRKAGFGSIATLSDATTYFYFYAYTTQEYFFPSINKEILITLLENSFNLNIDIPTEIDFKLFANRAVMTDVHNCTLLDNVGFTGENLKFARVQADHIFLSPNNLKDNAEYFDNTGKELFWSINAKENKSITLRVVGSCTKTGGGNVYLGILIDANNMLEIGVFDANFDKTITFMPPLGATQYVLCAYVNFGTMTGITGTVNVTCTYQYTSDIGKDIEMTPEKNFLFNCFENLPKISVLQFLKAIALANGYTLTFEGDNVNFKKLTDFFSIDNTFDASDYFIEADQLDFLYLKYKRNFIRYGANTPPYATIEVNDNTLESEGDFLVIENILPTDDDNVQLWDYTDPDKIKIREGVATIPFQALDLATYNSFAQFLDEAFVFTANFKAFRITGSPIYVKQLNGIFLPTEIIERISGSELKEIKLKMLKL